MFNKNNFCHIASNNRNEKKAGVFVYKTTDNLETVATSGYFNDKIVDINLHDLIIHEWHNPADRTDVQRNLLCVVERTLDNVGTIVIKGQWEEDIEQALDDLKTYIDENFVNIDGTSIMTGPLKFSAGSMRGAIAGGFNGLTFFKIDSEGNMTQIGSLSDTQFVPAADNTLDIGTNLRKVERIYLGKVNNGYDIDVPVTSSADTLALKSQVDDAANSGEQLYDTGVWYAKMYAGTTPPSADNGTNYADFSQVDGDNNPIIVIYERQNNAWVQIQTITPPANHNGYMTITSKIWDITEQAGQQGGLVLWAHNTKRFTPYPRIVSFDQANITNSTFSNGTITTSTFEGSATLSGTSTVTMPNNPGNTQIVNKQYVDDVANPLKYATNCITEIPQDINLEIFDDNGTKKLRLKAGSKVYVPAGSGTFNTVTTTTDLVCQGTGGTATTMVFYRMDGQVWGNASLSDCTSGTTTPNFGMFYNTSTNKVNFYNNGVIADVNDFSFPIAIITSSSGNVINIDQVFNGFGYMGSTIFALPGVKALIPNGKNQDGTLNNITVTLSACKTQTTQDTNKEGVCVLFDDANIGLGNTWDESVDRPSFSENLTQYWYNPDTNRVFWYRSSSQYGYRTNALVMRFRTDSNAQISSIDFKTVFHALDYNDLIANTLCAQNGYMKLGPVIIQWGFTGTEALPNPTTITFPYAFSSDTSFSVVAVGIGGNTQSWTDGVQAQTSTGFTWVGPRSGTQSDNACRWIAIGF